MSIESARANEDQVLEDELASGEIDIKEYNKQMKSLDEDQRGYEYEESHGGPESYPHQY
jgi:hypothetical protein